MEDRLKHIFSNVNDWLKFAEAKNGVLVAFNGAAIFGALQSLDKIRCINETLVSSTYFFMGFALAGIIISLLSFVPILNLSKKARARIQDNDVKDFSLMYFEHIRKFNADQYMEILNIRTDTKPPVEDSFCLDIANQIVANSRTAWWKYQMFVAAIHLTLIGLILPIPYLIITSFIKVTRRAKAK